MIFKLCRASMPEKKPSVSSAEEELVEKDLEAQDRPSVRREPYCLLPVVAIMLVTILLFIIGFAVFAYFLFGRGNGCTFGIGGWHRWMCHSPPLYANFMVDMKGLQSCDTSLHQNSERPCRTSRKLLTGSRQTGAKAFPLGPMACWDDAHAELGGSDNCKGNPFVLAENNTGIVIPLSAVYRVYAKVTFDDTVDYYVNAIIRVVPSACLSNPGCSSGSQEQRDARSHTWLSCFNHNRPPKTTTKRKTTGAKESSQFATCTLDGIRHFSSGDLVSLQVTQEFRTVNPYHKLTHMLIHKL